jgi:hypothetical protein
MYLFLCTFEVPDILDILLACLEISSSISAQKF